MKYFTPDLIIAANSRDDAIADKATYDWENALTAYENGLKEVNLPKSVKEFMNICLHDAEGDHYMNIDSHSDRIQLVITQKDLGEHKFVCILRYEIALPGHLSSLTDYVGYNPPIDFLHHKNLPGEGNNLFWLYDEFNFVGKAAGGDIFSHNILFSNGLELKINFTEFHFMVLPITDKCIEH
jgi:hypothetical protein